MAKGCGVGALKCLILTINTVMFIGGLCLAGVSGYTAFSKFSMLHQLITGAKIQSAMTGLYILFAVGIVMAFVSLLGCIGAANENRLLLWLNFFFVLLLFIAELVAVILCFYKYKVIEKEVLQVIKDSARSASVGVTNETLGLFALRAVFSLVETNTKCCGLHGPQDYGDHIPASCYPPAKGNSTTKTSSSSSSGTKSDDAPVESGGEVGGSEIEKAVAPTPTPAAAAAPPASASPTTTTPPASSSSTPGSTTTISTTPSTIQTTPSSASPPSTTSTIKSTTSMEPTSPTTTTPTPAAATIPSSPPTTTESAPESTTQAVNAPLSVESTTAVAGEASGTTTSETPSSGSQVNKGKHPYTIGCASKLKPVIYAAGGIGIAILLLELLLLIFVGCLLCEIGGGYESLA